MVSVVAGSREIPWKFISSGEIWIFHLRVRDVRYVVSLIVEWPFYVIFSVRQMQRARIATDKRETSVNDLWLISIWRARRIALIQWPATANRPTSSKFEGFFFRRLFIAASVQHSMLPISWVRTSTTIQHREREREGVRGTKHHLKILITFNWPKNCVYSVDRFAFIDKHSWCH